MVDVLVLSTVVLHLILPQNFLEFKSFIRCAKTVSNNQRWIATVCVERLLWTHLACFTNLVSLQIPCWKASHTAFEAEVVIQGVICVQLSL